MAYFSYIHKLVVQWKISSWHSCLKNAVSPPQPGRKPTKRKSLGIALSNGDGPGPWRPVGEPGEVVVTKSFQVYPDVGI